MGCDIHMVVQVKNEEGHWETSEAPGYGDRCYDVFAVLADVRNGTGFAGRRTGGGFIPISEPRGLPSDFRQPFNLDEDEDEDFDYANYLGDHSFSHLTLKEILDYPHWGAGCIKCGVVSKEGYATFKEKGQPESYSGGVIGPGVVHIPVEEMERRFIENDWGIDPQKILAGGVEPKFYTTVEWGELVKDRCRYFLEYVEQTLKPLGDPENVRIVFGFDS